MMENNIDITTRIEKLAEFFYSSNDSREVPLRICCSTGQYSGFDLEEEDFRVLFTILFTSQNLKQDLAEFVEHRYEE